MHRVKTYAILILIILVLPWGAYSKAHAAAPPTTDLSALTFAEAAQAGPMMRDLREAHQVSQQPKRCRTAVLTGSPCVGDTAIVGKALEAERGAPCSAGRPAHGALLIGLDPTGNPDPPRSC